MQNVWRIVWKSSKDGKFKYASGEDIKKYFGDNFMFEPGKPYLFLNEAVAERIARAMTDEENVEKVLLRMERTTLEIAHGLGGPDGKP